MEDHDRGAAPAAASPGAGTWNRRVWRIAGPVMVANISVPLLGIVDTAVVGHLPEPYFIGAVAVGALIFTYIYWTFVFLRMGTTGFTAQAYGGGDGDEVRASLARATLLALGLGVLVLIVQWPVAGAALGLIDASPEVEGLAAAYFRIRVWAIPAGLWNYVAIGWLIGVQNARAMLGLQVFMNGLNIILDIVFVVGLGWGVEGVAYATLISEYSAALVAIVIIVRSLRGLGGAWRGARILDPARLRRMMHVNRDIFIRTLCLVSAFAYFTAVSARMGDVTLAANVVLMNFFALSAYGLDGLAHAAGALVGGAVGAGDRAALRAAVRVSSLWALVFALLFTVLFGLGGGLLIDLITDLGQVRGEARDFLPWAVALPLVSVWSFQLDGIFVGATRGREMRNMMALSLAAYLGATAVLVPWLGNHGLWLAFVLFMVFRGVTLAIHYPALERVLQK